MEVYLVDKPSEQTLFNCSAKQQPLTVEQVLSGGFFLAAYVFFMTLYVPCLWALCTSKYRHRSCYKLMIMLSCTQILGLQFAGLYAGIMNIWGGLFCVTPDYEYIICGMFCCNWICSTTVGNVLGINRVFELFSSKLARTLFGGWKVYIWISLPLLYGGSIFLYQFYVWMAFSLIYNSIKCWFLPTSVSTNQMLSYMEQTHGGHVLGTSNTYLNRVLAFHTTSVCFVEIFINAMIVFLYLRESRKISIEARSKLRHEKQIIVQVILIGLINFATCTIITLIQLHPLPIDTRLIATSGYLISQGFTSIVYLSVNRSIRNTILQKIGLNSKKINHRFSNLQPMTEKVEVNS